MRFRRCCEVLVLSVISCIGNVLLMSVSIVNSNIAIVLGIIAAVILVITLLIALFLRKRLLIAIALIKEGSRFVHC